MKGGASTCYLAFIMPPPPPYRSLPNVPLAFTLSLPNFIQYHCCWIQIRIFFLIFISPKGGPTFIIFNECTVYKLLQYDTKADRQIKNPHFKSGYELGLIIGRRGADSWFWQLTFFFNGKGNTMKEHEKVKKKQSHTDCLIWSRLNNSWIRILDSGSCPETDPTFWHNKIVRYSIGIYIKKWPNSSLIK